VEYRLASCPHKRRDAVVSVTQKNKEGPRNASNAQNVRASGDPRREEPSEFSPPLV
jgi:hypothetical protein